MNDIYLSIYLSIMSEKQFVRSAGGAIPEKEKNQPNYAKKKLNKLIKLRTFFQQKKTLKPD